MNKFLLFFLILCILFITGCVTHQYQGNNFPSYSSSSFPSFSPVSEITDGIKIKLPEASGKTKMFINFKITKGQQSVSVNSDIDWKWDINVEDNLIYNNHIMEMVVSAPNERKKLKIKFDGIHETSGKEINMDVSFDSKENELTVEELNKFKKRMSDYINNQFVSLGKTVKTGDVLKYVPNEMSDMKKNSDSHIKDEFPEVIKGLGVFRDKSVVVTEYILEDSIYNPDFVMEVRGKGYNLYDAETFIQLFGKAVIYMSAFSPKEGTIYFKMDLGLQAHDVQIRNIINSSSYTHKGAIKEPIKSSWSEASDKIKSLGELLEKGLISKEEYEIKKKELLKTF